MKRTVLIIIAVIALASCGENSSPDGRAQLRDKKLAQKIEELNQRQIVILDSLELLDHKIKTLTNQ